PSVRTVLLVANRAVAGGIDGANAVLHDYVVVGLDHRRERGDSLVAAKPHHDHALRRTPEPLDLVDRHPNHGAAGRDEHDLVAVANDPGPGERALRLGHLDRLDS